MTAGSLLAETFVNVGLNTEDLVSGISKVKALAGGLGGTITAALGPIALAIGGAFAIKEMVGAFIEGEQASVALSSALRTNGQEVDNNLAHFQKLAAELQGITTLDDEAVIGLVTLGTNLGLPASAMDNAAKSAIGLGRALGMDASAAMEALAKETQGVKSNLDRSIPSLKGVEDSQQRLAIISEFAAKGFEQEQDQANTLGGGLTQLWNSVGNLAESFGAVLAPALTLGVECLTEFFDWVGNVMNGVLEFGVHLPESFNVAGQAVSSFGGMVGSALSAVAGFIEECVFTVLNFDLVVQEWGLIFTDVAYGIVDSARYMWDMFIAFGGWFVGNFGNIWRTTLDYALTALVNWGSNISTIFTEVWEFIKSGFTDSVDLSGLKSTTEGAKNTIGEMVMPEYKDSFDKGKEQQALQKVWDSRRAEWDSIVHAKPLDDLGEVGELQLTDNAKDGKDKKKKTDKTEAGTFSALGTAFQKANSSAAKAQEKREEEALKMQKKQLDESKKTNENLDKLVLAGGLG